MLCQCLEIELKVVEAPSMNCYPYSDSWRKLSASSKFSIVMAGVALISATSGPVMDQSSNNNGLKSQLRTEFMDYHDNRWDQTVGWSQYSDPGFVDYLNSKKPSLLITVRDFLVR